MSQLLESLLVILIGFGLSWLMVQIDVELDVGVFNAIVAGIVLWILRLLGLELTFRVIASVRRLLKRDAR